MLSLAISLIIFSATVPVSISFTPFFGRSPTFFVRPLLGDAPWTLAFSPEASDTVGTQHTLCDEEQCIDLDEAEECLLTDDCEMEDLSVMASVLEHVRDGEFQEGGSRSDDDQELMERMLLEEDLEDRVRNMEANAADEFDPLCDEEACIDLNDAELCAEDAADCSLEELEEYQEVLQSTRDDEFLEGGVRGDNQKLMERMLLEDDIEEKISRKKKEA